MTNAQANRIADIREYWDRSTFYEMPADHRHSPGVVIAVVEMWNQWERQYDDATIRLHPDGRREAVTDLHSEAHFRADARQEGRRI